MGEPVKFERKNEVQLIPRENMNAVGDQIGELEAYKKALDAQSKDIRSALVVSMQEYEIDKWTTPNGTQITLVVEKDKEVAKFDFDLFAKENPALVEKYTREHTQYGKAPYVKITPPKQ